ncbi:MAG: lytic transglycosylase domain-containing protein [Rhizobium sp.]|nr:lytic transglycosylase domain-containing protein [Rhizobium sp.]
MKTIALPRQTAPVESKADRVTPDDTSSLVASAEPAGEDLPSEILQPMPLPQPSDTYLSGMSALGGRNSLAAIAHRDRMEPGSVEWKAMTWAIAISGQRAVPSTMIAETIRQLPDWPGQSILRQNLEAAVHGENPPASLVLSELGPGMPVTADGAIVLARAALATADRGRATGVIRSVWFGKRMDKADEDKILVEFGDLLTKADHKRRMEFLLYKERYDDAARFADLAEAQSLYKAFVAVGRSSKSADTLIKAVDASWHKDPSYLYLKIKRQRQKRNYADAAALLESAPRDIAARVDPGAWWVEARIVSRGLMDEGNAKRAYRLAASHLAVEPSDIVEAEFHAGWFALRGLNDAKAAETHFKTLLAASPKAHDQSRALYWLGRTAEQGKDPQAQAYYKRAARFPATFYGQLSAGKLGEMIAPGAVYAVSDADRLAFQRRDEIIAISLMEKAGEPSRARRLYLALAASLEKPAEVQLLAEKALRDHGATLALAIGKTALRQGHDPGLAAFPLGAIPETADISGAGKALAYAIARQESAFNPQAVSPANAKGLLQLLPSTAKRVASRHQLAYAEEKLTEDPAFNATLGSHYLGEQIDKFDGSLIMTFAAYNAGPGRVNQWIKRYGDPRGKGVEAAIDWIESIPFTETRDYVQRVMENYQVYKMLLNQKADIVADVTAGK